MASFYYGATHHQNSGASSHSSHGNNNNHHTGRARRGPRLSSQNSHRQFRGVRSMRELSDPPIMTAFLKQFEACKGFDLDDDLEFCPSLLTEDDYSSISSASDRSSMSSGSPSSSPLQQQSQPMQQVSPPFSLAQTYQPTSFTTSHSQPHLKLHQPSAVRSHKAIPIVNPSTGMRVASPPSSISPARMQQQPYGRRW